MLDEKILAVAELLSESWRLNQFTRNLAAHVADEKLRKKISNQVARFDKKFLQATEVIGVEVVDFTGTEFETGLPVTPSRFKSGGTIGVTRNFSQAKRYRLDEVLRQKIDRSANDGRFVCPRHETFLQLSARGNNA